MWATNNYTSQKIESHVHPLWKKCVGVYLGSEYFFWNSPNSWQDGGFYYYFLFKHFVAYSTVTQEIIMHTKTHLSFICHLYSYLFSHLFINLLIY